MCLPAVLFLRQAVGSFFERALIKGSQFSNEKQGFKTIIFYMFFCMGPYKALIRPLRALRAFSHKALTGFIRPLIVFFTAS